MSDPGPAQAREEAAAWFARLSRVAVSSETLREFRAWRARPGNQQAYEAVERAWRTAGGVSQDPQIRAATEAALRSPGGAGRGGAWTAALGGFGAAAALAGAAAWFVLGAGPAYETGVGEQRLVVLDDGSRIRLNTDSAVRVRYRPGERQVALERGQAFFEAAPDPSRPFVVAADGVRVTALGTRFDVRRAGESVQVTLVEGRVAVSLAGRAASAQLAPNQKLTATPAALSAPRPADAAEAAGWTTGRLTFRNVPLRTAVAEVNRYSERKLRLEAPPAVAEAPVSGVFDVGDVAAFTAAVEAIFPIEAQAGAGETRLVAVRAEP